MVANNEPLWTAPIPDWIAAAAELPAIPADVNPINKGILAAATVPPAKPRAIFYAIVHFIFYIGYSLFS